MYIDAIPVLACASLEALTGTYKSGRVIARVLPRYELSEDAVPRLETFYKLRQWFAHGADVPEMREAEVRSETLDDGLRLVKGILRSALADPQLLAAANEGTATVKQYLDNREY